MKVSILTYGTVNYIFIQPFLNAFFQISLMLKIKPGYLTSENCEKFIPSKLGKLQVLVLYLLENRQLVIVVISTERLPAKMSMETW